jgi:predicted phosphodiesterase
MVKKILKKFLPILWIYITISCNVDMGGLFASTDLDERLKERNNSKFINSRDLSPLTLGDEYSFIVIADIHIKNGNAYGLENIKTLIDNNPQIKFAVFCGDITQKGDEQELKKFIEITGNLPIHVYPVIGNHDVFFGNWSAWKKLIGSTSYKVNGDTAALYILDSANGFLGKGQIDWLEKDLKKVKANGKATDRVFIFSHHNLIGAPLLNIQQSADTKERARLISLLSGKCDIMFTGHSHDRLIKEAGGTLYISIEDFITYKTYCLVTVNKTGISYEFKRL